MIHEALEMGYTVFALHQLQPSPKKWDLAKLREFSSTQDVNNLDPYLSRLIVDYINSAIDRIPGFKITDGMRASRQAKQGQLGFGPPPKEKPSAISTAPPRVTNPPPNFLPAIHQQHPQGPQLPPQCLNT